MSVPKLIIALLIKKGITDPNRYGKDALAVKTFITLPKNAGNLADLAAIFNKIENGGDAVSIIDLLSKTALAGDDVYPHTLSTVKILLNNDSTVEQIVAIFDRLTSKHADNISERLQEIADDDAATADAVNETLEIYQGEEAGDSEVEEDAELETVDFDELYGRVAKEADVTIYQDEDGNYQLFNDGNSIEDAVLGEFENGLVVVDFDVTGHGYEAIYPVVVRTKSVSIGSLKEIITKLLSQTEAPEDESYAIESMVLLGRVLTVQLVTA